MRHTRKLVILSGTLLVTLLALCIFFPTNRVQAAYEGSNIIDNGIFLDAGSMSTGTIQNFLASKNSGLANRNFNLSCYGPGSREWDLYTSIGAPCGQDVPASHIIYYTAQVYGISPKVILATLQKEQSLVTNPNPTVWNINQAMGYGCPTTGDCDGNSSFFWQLDNGTWALRYHYERANRNFSWWSPSSSWVCGTEKPFYKPNLFPQQNVSFYDEAGVHYRTYFLANAATSSMYCYTPHAYNNPQGLYNRPPYGTVGQYYSGSYNFVASFEAWFGSTKNNEHMWRVIRTTNDGRLFLQVANTKRWIPSGDIYTDWGLNNYPVNIVSEAEFNSIPTIPELTRLGTTGQYNYVVERGRKHFIPNNYLGLWGYQNTIAAPVTSLLSTLSEYEPMGRFIKAEDSSYWLINSGSRHAISGADLYAWRHTPQDTVGIGSSYLSYIPTSQPASRFIQFSNTSYVVDRGELIRMPDSTTAAAWRPSGYQTMSSAAPSLLPVRGNASFLVRSVDAPHWYMLEQGTRHYIADGSVAANWGLNGNLMVTVNNDLLAQIPQGMQATNFARDPSNHKVYVLDGTKHHVINGTLLDTLTPTADVIITSTNTRLAKIPDGTNYTSPLIQATNTPHVYILDAGKKYHVSSGELLNAYNNRGVGTLSNSYLNSVSYGAGVLQGVVAGTQNDYYLIDSGKRWLINQTYTNRWRNSNTPTFSISFLSLFSAGEQTINTSYLKNRNDTYLVEQGSKIRIVPQLVQSYVGSSGAFNQQNNTLPNRAGEAAHLLKSQEDQKVWFINQATKTEVNFSQQVSLGYLSGNVEPTPVSANFLSSFPTSSHFSLLIRKQNGWGVKLLNFGTALGFPDGETLNSFVSDSNPIQVVDDWTYDRFPLTGSVSRVLKDDSGKLYLVQNGQKSWLSSHTVYAPYASIPITYLYGTTMQLVPTGAVIAQ